MLKVVSYSKAVKESYIQCTEFIKKRVRLFLLINFVIVCKRHCLFLRNRSFAKLIYNNKKGYNKCALAETLTFALVGIPNNRVTPKS